MPYIARMARPAHGFIQNAGAAQGNHMVPYQPNGNDTIANPPNVMRFTIKDATPASHSDRPVGLL